MHRFDEGQDVCRVQRSTLVRAPLCRRLTRRQPVPRRPPGGTTFFNLLAEHRGVRNVGNLPLLIIDQILSWTDAFRKRNGEWPICRCIEQSIPGTDGERWFNIDQTLRKGLRGLPGGSSLAKLLAERCGVPNLKVPMKDRIATA